MNNPNQIVRRTTDVDVHVGQRIRQRRTLLGMSQTQLGEALGVSFQQVQKTERGFNRVPAGRLPLLASVLGVSIPYFFEGVDATAMPVPRRQGAPVVADPLARRETLELVRAYYRIEDPSVRRKFCDLIRAVAGEKDEALSETLQAAAVAAE